MPEEDKADKHLEMTFERLFCSRHGEPFRADWPKGYAAAFVAMMEMMFKDEGVLKAAAAKGVDEDGNAKVELLPAVLDELPLCCRLGNRKLLQVYLQAHKTAGLGAKTRCEVCGRLRQPGTKYTTASESVGHVCFACVLTRMKPSD